MPVYAYKGLNAKGKATSGVIDTESPRTLQNDLRNRQIFLTEYSEQTAQGKAAAVVATGQKQQGSRDINFGFMNNIPLTTVSEMT
ncbi:MAG: hypothetical protein IV100_33250, partial [Myxococcales bacterium]|nr:hypothetical protein [Myxococcales bacterium]